MRKVAAYFLAGVLVVLATCAIAAIVPVPSVNAGPVARGGTPVQWVDRSGKSDRLDLNTSVNRKLPQQRIRQRIMSGCEPVFSTLAAARADNFAGRCTAGGADWTPVVG